MLRKLKVDDSSKKYYVNYRKNMENVVMKQATLNYIKGEWYFNISIEYGKVEVMDVDVGENNVLC